MTTALDRVRELYDQLPSVNCKGLCWNSCGPIDMSNAERERTIELGVDIPVFTEERSQRWAANERLYCPALTFSSEAGGGIGCSIYQDRPLICRIWGVGEDDLACPNGCETTGRLSFEEVSLLLIESFRLGGHDGDMENAGEVMAEMLKDPEIGPLMKRMMQGDLSVKPQIAALMRSR